MLLRDATYPVHKAEDARFHHVVLTRFNMRLLRASRGIETAEQLRQWVDDRMREFLAVCLPSITGQERTPHRWLIGVDGLHPEITAPLVEACAPWPWIEIIEQREGDEVEDAFARALSRTPSSATHLVTTRLDCDDALSVDHVRVGQAYARSVLGRPDAPESFWLSMPVGAQLVGSEFSLYMHTTNHFLSRVVTADRAAEVGATALSGMHSRVLDHGDQVFTPMTSTPMWLQNVHGQNVLNKARKDAIVFADPAQVAQTFGLPVPPARSSWVRRLTGRGHSARS